MNTTGQRRIPWDEYVALHVREIGLGLLAIVALVFAWCYVDLPGGTELTGTVTSAGRSVTYGTVTVVASDDRVYTAPIGPDGSYRIKALPPGPVRVAVSSPNPRSVVDQMASAGASGGVAPEQPQADRPESNRPGASERAAAGGAGKPAAARAVAGSGGKSPGGKGAAEPEQVSVAAPNGAAPPFPAPAPAAAKQQGQQQGWFRIPGRYASPATSGIRGEVGRGRTPLHIRAD